MSTSKNGIEIIKEHEAFRSKPYLCPAGIPTIGYGATYYPNGRKVKITDKPITRETAEEILLDMLKKYERAVNRYVQLPINQNQFDALVSFCYNVGPENFRRSTLLKRINKNPCDPDIKRQFARWNRGGGRVLNGLIRRRKEEANLYFS